jgi:RimJ/RimL family protein N-acetyltransferase
MPMNAHAPPAFRLPAALLSQRFALRPETDADLPFLMRLYASTREAELAVTGWSADDKQAFCDSQFHAQRHHYRTYIPNCRFDVLECRDEAVGRLYLETRVTQLNIVDIALLPEWCGKGFGTAILKALMDTAARSGRGVSIFVEKFNPALRLYRRLGFGETRDVGIHLEMEWMPAGGTASLS